MNEKLMKEYLLYHEIPQYYIIQVQKKVMQFKEDHIPERYESEGENEQFSSFSSARESNDGNETDEKGFMIHSGYASKDLTLPSPPSHLAQLYSLYANNLARKQKLQDSIEHLKKKQILLTRLSRESNSSTIEEFIDQDQQSPEYLQSLQKHEARCQEIKHLENKYRGLRVMLVESMLRADPHMMHMMNKYIEENKQVNAWAVKGNRVMCLSRERLRLRKNLKGTLSVMESKSKSSEDESQDNLGSQVYKYVLRCFSFTFNKEYQSFSFSPVEKIGSLNLGAVDYEALIFMLKIEKYYTYRQNTLVLIPSGHSIEYDRKIIFCGVRNQQLYLATEEGIVRVYEVLQTGEMKLERIYSCFKQPESKVTHMTLPNNSETLLFIEDSFRLCQLNLQTYSISLLSELPQPAIFMDSLLLTTQNMIYKHFYSFNGIHGKAALIHHPTIKEQLKSKTLISTTIHEKIGFLILNSGHGNVSFSLCKELFM